MGHFRLVLSFAEVLHHVLLVFEEVTFSQSPSRAGLSLARVTPINLMQERVLAMADEYILHCLFFSP